MTISDTIRERVKEASRNRCGYCQMSAEYVYSPMEIDHIIPKAMDVAGDEENLWLACPRCNNFESDQTYATDPITEKEIKLFNPRLQKWTEHFAWSEDGGHAIGQTPCGRATVIALRINIDAAVAFRRLLASIGRHPPKL